MAKKQETAGIAPTFDIDAVKRTNVERDFRHGCRGESASRCIGDITKGCDIFGLTKGDFSKIDILKHIISQIGACNIDIGTWTASGADIKQAYDLFNNKNILRLRWLVDRSFPARQKDYYNSLVDNFGRESIRIARFHAKFILLENENYSVAVRTSMNLNMNHRIEFYEISEGSPISGYLKQIVDHHFESSGIEDSTPVFKNFRIKENEKETKQEQNKIGNW